MYAQSQELLLLAKMDLHHLDAAKGEYDPECPAFSGVDLSVADKIEVVASNISEIPTSSYLPYSTNVHQ